MAFEDDPRRAARKNSFGDAAAAVSNPNVTQIPVGSHRPAPPPDGSQDSPLNNELGRNITNAAMAIPGAAAVPFAGARTAGALAGLAGRAGPAATMTGQMAAKAAPAGVPLLGAAGIGAAYSADKARPQVAASPADAGRGAANPAVVNPSGPLPESALPMPLPGIYRQGNSYSDSAAGLATSSTGQPNAQNMAAAQALAPAPMPLSQRATKPQPAYAANTIPLIQAAGISHSGNGNMWSRSPEQQRRDAEVQASSIHGKTAAMGNAALKGLDGRELEAMRNAAGTEQAAMRESGATARTQMQEQGATGRSLVSIALEQQKVNQAGEAWGYTNRANKLVEAARNQVAAERDPGKRRNLVQYMQDLEGKSQQADPYLVVPGGQQVDEMGKPYNMPSSVFNRQTQQFVQQQPAQGGAQPSANHLAALRANPKQADFFDLIYGKGSAARILGGG